MGLNAATCHEGKVAVWADHVARAACQECARRAMDAVRLERATEKGKKRMRDIRRIQRRAGRQHGRAGASNGSGNDNDITAGCPRLEPVRSNLTVCAGGLDGKGRDDERRMRGKSNRQDRWPATSDKLCQEEQSQDGQVWERRGVGLGKFRKEARRTGERKKAQATSSAYLPTLSLGIPSIPPTYLMLQAVARWQSRHSCT